MLNWLEIGQRVSHSHGDYKFPAGDHLSSELSLEMNILTWSWREERDQRYSWISNERPALLTKLHFEDSLLCKTLNLEWQIEMPFIHQKQQRNNVLLFSNNVAGEWISLFQIEAFKDESGTRLHKIAKNFPQLLGYLRELAVFYRAWTNV